MVTLELTYDSVQKDRLLAVFARFLTFYGTILALLFVLIKLPSGDFSIHLSDFTGFILIQFTSHMVIFWTIFMAHYRTGTIRLKTGSLHAHALETTSFWLKNYKFEEIHRDDNEIHFRFTPNRLSRFFIAQPYETVVLRDNGDAIEIFGSSRHIAYMDNKLRWDARIQSVLKR